MADKVLVLGTENFSHIGRVAKLGEISVKNHLLVQVEEL
jgi:hypothetical protein